MLVALREGIIVYFVGALALTCACSSGPKVNKSYGPGTTGPAEEPLRTDLAFGPEFEGRRWNAISVNHYVTPTGIVTEVGYSAKSNDARKLLAITGYGWTTARPARVDIGGYTFVNEAGETESPALYVDVANQLPNGLQKGPSTSTSVIQTAR